MPFYAVRIGRKPGIYETRDEAEKQTLGFSKAKHKKFSTISKAKAFLGAVDCGHGLMEPLKKKFKAEDASKSVLSRNNAANCDSENRECAIVYTHGACSANGTINACAGIGVYWGENDSRNVSERLVGRQTNNSAEIRAAVRAVNQAKSYKFKSIKIRTDSQFLIGSMTSWIKNWVEREWKTAAGKKVKNIDDFEALLAASEGIDVIYEKVVAHSGDLCNDAVKKLAVEGARQ